MNAVDRVGRHFDGAVETERQLAPPQVIINRLRKGNNVKPLLPEQVGRLLASIAAKHHEAFQF